MAPEQELQAFSNISVLLEQNHISIKIGKDMF